VAVESGKINFRLRRETEGFVGWAQDAWTQRSVRWATYAGLAAIVFGIAFWAIFLRGLPSVDMLRAYEPPMPTNVRQIDGTPIHSYARERRVELSYDEYPPLMVRAFLAAEDRTFFEHGGIDYLGIVSAAITNLKNSGRPIGASTITQQVAKNLLLTNEVSYVRKLKEAILAKRIEGALTKQQILEIYLNTIFLGRNAYGVEAASHAYFDKDLDELTLPQFAYLAILPKGPANYDPDRDTQRALSRRNWVLGEMLRNEFITQAQHDQAVAMPLMTAPRQAPKFERAGGYFVEEVRRQLIDKFGENASSGPYSVYSGGLWVRTSFDPQLQQYAQEALRDGLMRFDGGRGWTGPLGHVTITGGAWRGPFANANIGLDYKDWQAAVVIDKGANSAQLGFADGSTGTLLRGNAQMPVRGQGGSAYNAIEDGDVIAVAPAGPNNWQLRTLPKISGGFVVEQPGTGRVLAMQGGFESRVQAFNRASQAQRQPGSTIKPIVYSAALENGMTPASIIIDGPFCVDQGARLGTKCFRNFGGGGGSGPHTMRWGIEQSRNLMTVRAAAATGMDKVTDTMKRLGVGTYPPYLAFALGAGETTLMKMVNAYTILASQGKALQPSLIDFVQDRHGKVIWPENWRACEGCNARDWDGKAMPRPITKYRQAIDPLTAFQMVHITQGVIQRGTAVVLNDLGRPIFGKTGTTTGPTDVWFIGGTPQYIGGLYIGYDKPTPLGGYAQGGTIAAPIFKQFAKKAYEGLPVLPFRAPNGIRMVRIDRASGRKVYGAWPSLDDPRPAVIWEAFKPESEPRRSVRHEEVEKPKAKATAVQRDRRDSDFLQRQGGIY
jgi:penicillin-binding protein 1A